jgi:acetyl esterase/lipase
MSFLGFLKKLILFILIVAIAIPLRYGSTNHKYVLIRVLHSILSLKHSLVPDQTRPTLSANYRAFENLFRLRLVPNSDPLADPLPFIKNMRLELKFDTIIPKLSHCQVNKEIFEHDGHVVDAYWVDHRQENVQKKSDKILLYLHGGEYIAGDIHGKLFNIFIQKRFFYIFIGYSGFQCHLSQLFNLSVLHVEYRLCPEHPLPVAVEDSVAVYRALLRQNISPSQLFIMGDSAGGGLALLTVQAIITHQLPVTRGVIALSP